MLADRIEAKWIDAFCEIFERCAVKSGDTAAILSETQSRALNVHLADPEGAYLRVSETWVRYGVDTPKSQAGERTIALGQRVAAELFEQRARTAFMGDDERVFCSPTRGSAFDVQRYSVTFRKALAKAGITDYVRPFHDMRHSSITNAAAAGTPPAA